MTTETLEPAAARLGDLRRNVGVNAYEKLRTVLEINRTLGSSLNFDLVLAQDSRQLDHGFPADGSRLHLVSRR